MQRILVFSILMLGLVMTAACTKEEREEIKSSAEEAKEEIKKAAGNVKDASVEAAEKAKQAAKEGYEEAKNAPALQGVDSVQSD